MRILVTGACGFVGSTLIKAWAERGAGHDIVGVDNLLRPGSESNRETIREHGGQFFHGDIRSQNDVDALPGVDFVIDAAANPSVLAGVAPGASSRQLMEHNLLGTVNLLEYCRRHEAGLILLSTSRVYGLEALTSLPLDVTGSAFSLPSGYSAPGVSERGIAEDFSTTPPLSLYGTTKAASELLALEYSTAFDFPVWVNRCGVLAGAGQFGHPTQGIFAFWINAWQKRLPLRYTSFDGTGHQVRDCLHPRDLVPLLDQQLLGHSEQPRVINVSGGVSSATSLAQLSEWCSRRFGPHEVSRDSGTRKYDVPWLVLDSTLASRTRNWEPTITSEEIFEEIAVHAERHEGWLEMSSS